jgi:hypothetical protein
MNFLTSNCTGYDLHCVATAKCADQQRHKT